MELIAVIQKRYIITVIMSAIIKEVGSYLKNFEAILIISIVGPV